MVREVLGFYGSKVLGSRNDFKKGCEDNNYAGNVRLPTTLDPKKL
jgi:hypothetical protein